MAVLTGQKLATFAQGKKGTPYVYGAKGADGPLTQAKLDYLAKVYASTFTTSYLEKAKKYVGKTCTDCSGLISWYTGKVYGSAQLYSQAYARLPISQWKKFAVGTVLWKEGHVGVYLGDGKVAEARGINYGTIISNISDVKWVYGLTFSWMSYDIVEVVDSTVITYKTSNPFTEPTTTVKKGDNGTSVKWLQYELVEAGFSISIDGDFGSKTYDALISFQKSSKLTVDGKCGPVTRAALKANVSPITTTTTKSSTNPYTEPTTTVKSGDKDTGSSTAVKWVQWELNQSGASLTVDGSFGPKSVTALKTFQAAHALTVDGKCGPATRTALKKY